MFKKLFFSFSILYIFQLTILAQSPVAISDWKTYLPYSSTISVANASDKIYAANASSVFSLNKSDNAYELLHKANVLSDVSTTHVFYGLEQNTLVITYLNSNIDFIINDTVFNFPFIKTGNISGLKSIQEASFYGDTVFLSCGFGIVVFDLTKKESPASYNFLDESSSYFSVNSSTVFQDKIYAATVNGLFTGSLFESNLQDFSQWELLSGSGDFPDGNVQQVKTFNGKLFASFDDGSIYSFDGISWNIFFAETDFYVRNMHATDQNLMLLTYKGDLEVPEIKQIRTLDTSENVQIFDLGENVISPRNLTRDNQNTFWISDPYKGLVKFDPDENYFFLTPNSPATSKVFDMEFYNHILWVAAGEINLSWNYALNRDGFFTMNYGFWSQTNVYDFAQLDTTLDLISIAINAITNKTYFASFGGGVVEYDVLTNTLQVFDETNTDGALQTTPGDLSSCRIGGLQFDGNGNLWMGNYGAVKQLAVYTAEGIWKNFDCGLPSDAGNQMGQVVIDDLDQKWVQIPRGHGIVVYNHGANILDESDDQHRVLSIGSGNGNLPVSYVNCLVKDKDGEIWVGTNEGVAIFYNPSEIFSGTTSGDASQPLVNLGGYNELLLSKEIINCIAIDGANRKWIGTNSGVFLINEDGTEQLLFFNEDNTPLISNSILNITIDGETGEVFLGTAKGICSFRYTATDGKIENINVKVFPNPVRPEYSGLIAINGLVENAQVKITDPSGRLIYETTALGGQAIWNGKNYEGKRAHSGVYLIYASNDDGKETYVAKVLIMN